MHMMDYEQGVRDGIIATLLFFMTFGIILLIVLKLTKVI